MHIGETQRSLGMNMKALHQSLMKQNTAMMLIVSIKNNHFCFPALFLILTDLLENRRELF